MAIRNWTRTGFVTGLLILLGWGFAAYLGARKSTEYHRRWLRSAEVLAQVQALRRHAAEALAAVRGDPVSGREHLPAPGPSSARELSEVQRQLRQLAADDPRQRERVERLEVLVARHREIVGTTAESRRSGGQEASSGHDPRIMEQIRSLASEVEDEERRRRSGLEALASAADARLHLLLAVGTLIAPAVLLGAWFVLNAEAARRRRAEAANRDLAAMVDSTDDAMISETLDGIITGWNPSAERILGHGPGEVIGRPMRTLFPPDRGPEEAGIRERIGRGERIENMETVRLRKGGMRVEASVTISPVRDAGGRIRGAATILREITERKRVESRLRASLNELGDLKAALDEHAIVAMTDPQGRITFVNDKFCAISKFSREELMGQDHRIINSGHHSKAFIGDLWTTIARGGVWKGEIKNRAKDGSYYWVDTTIVPFLNEAGKPRQYVAIRADITERKRLELAVRESEERFRTMANSIPQLAWIARADGFIT